MHYNGDSKRTWHGSFSPQALARALRSIYASRTGDTALTRHSRVAHPLRA